MEYKQSTKPLSKHWKIEKKQESSYSGGAVEYVSSMNCLACLKDGNIAFLSLVSGEVKGMLVLEGSPEYAEEIVCFTIHPDGTRIITACRNQLIRIWRIEDHEVEKSWKAHEAPIACMACDPTGRLLITGSSDHTAKVWDISKGYCTHNFRHSFGVVHLAQFSKSGQSIYAITCCDDLVIRIWNLYERKENQLIAELKGHLNTVTALYVYEDTYLLSASRDKTIILWDMLTGDQLKTTVVYEAIEDIIGCPASYLSLLEMASKGVDVLLCGEQGSVQLCQVQMIKQGKSMEYTMDRELHSEGDNEVLFYKEEMEKKQAKNKDYYASLFVLKKLLLNPTNHSIIGVTNSNNFKVYTVSNHAISFDSVLIGNNDEVVDICYMGDTDHLAVATNSYELRLLSIPTFSSHLLYGHRDTILSVKSVVNGAYLLTCSKDRTIRLWHSASHMCLAVCEGHMSDVSCIALSQKPHAISKQLITMLFQDAWRNDFNHAMIQSAEYWMNQEASEKIPDYWVSGSEDKTLKLWELTAISNGVIRGAKVTVKAHEKSINALCISPNDKLVASGSMDKTIKLWSVPSMENVMTLKGHRKGIWDVSFSTINNVLLSCSGDQTIRVWNVKEGSTLYTIEGFDHSLLRCSFLSANMQILSCDNAGIIKLNNVASKECIATLDAHEDRIWALAIPQDKSNDVDTFVSGGADGQIMIWKDNTREMEEAELAGKEVLFMKEQEFQKCLQQEDYEKALHLAFELNKPYSFRLLVEKIIRIQPDAYESALLKLLSGLTAEDLGKLLGYVREWNLLGRTFLPAQIITRVLLKLYSFDELQKVKGIEEVVNTLLAYNKRHLDRIDRLKQSSYLIDYILQNMSVLQADESVKKRNHTLEMENRKKRKVEIDVKGE